MSLHLNFKGGATVNLHYFGINHGMGMTFFIYKPNGEDNNIGYMADLVTPGAVLFSQAPDSNLQDLIRTYQEILALSFNKVVFSHSQLPENRPDGTKKDVQIAYQYAFDLRAAVDKELAKGTDLIANPGAVDLPKYKSLARYDQFFKDNIFKFTLERIIGPHPYRSVERFLNPSKKD